MKIHLSNVRLAFAQLWIAKQVNGEGKPAFSASFLMPPDHPQVPEIKAAIEAVAKEKWGAKAADVYKAIKAANKLCFRSGDDKIQYDGFEGNMYISARGSVKPLILGPGMEPLTEQDGKPYSGCYVNAVIEIWAQDNAYGKRINAGLSGVQFRADGEPFSGSGSATTDDFKPVEGVKQAAGAAAPAGNPFD